MMRRAFGVTGVAVVLGAAIAGCGPARREEGASAVAEAFATALAEGDTAAACAALAPETAEALTSNGDRCEAALRELELAPGPAHEVEVWGDRAQVRTDADVLFLTEFAAGWKIAAAGCVPDGERPYQCEVSGS